MKQINNTLLRSIFAILLGLMLILWTELAILYLVMTIGVLFIFPGSYRYYPILHKESSNLQVKQYSRLKVPEVYCLEPGYLLCLNSLLTF